MITPSINIPAFLGTTKPRSPNDGEMYLDANSNEMFVYFGKKWNLIESTVYNGRTWVDDLHETLKKL